MMLKSLTAILSVLIITIVIITTNPQLHKPLAIGGSEIAIGNKNVIQNQDIKVTNQKTTSNDNKINVKNIEKTKNIDNLTTKAVEADKNLEKLLKVQAQEDAKAKAQSYTPPKVQQEVKKTTTTTKPAIKKTTTAKTTATVQQPKTVTSNKKTTSNKAQTTTNTSKPTQTVTEEEVKKQLEKVLTEYEETILWNRWRANVANTVAEKLNPYFTQIIPLGTIYRYDFDVNNKGQISNIKVRLTKGYVNTYSNQGAAMINDAIKSLNGNAILAFPKGTNRTSVTVSSGIERTENSRPIDESAFNDAETILKQMYQYK